jgi:osmotically-inducible protein OsmY
MQRRRFLASLAATLAAVSVVGCAGSRTRESTGEYIDDTTITSKVKTALLKDTYVSGLDIQVETYKGVVQLSGFADTDSEIRRAGDIARNVSGVRSVKNDIRVKQ